MGLRIRKSWGAGPVRFNLSKSGIGGSIGVKGARLTRTANGRTRSTLSIPGSGISYVTESSGKKKKTASKTEVQQDIDAAKKANKRLKRFYTFNNWLAIVSLCMCLYQIVAGSLGWFIFWSVPFVWGFTSWISSKLVNPVLTDAGIEGQYANIPCGVRNKETGEIFPTLEAAAASIDQKSSASISRSIGQGTKAGGYHWEFVTRRQLEENGN